MPDIKEKLVDILRLKPYNMSEVSAGRLADHLIANGVTVLESNLKVLESATDNNVGCKWVSAEESLPDNFVSVLGYMTDAGEFPPVRECYTVGNAFFFPALGDVHPVSRWCKMPEPPKGEQG